MSGVLDTAEPAYMATLLYASCVIAKMLELGYIEGVGFTVNADKCRSDLLLLQIEGVDLPDHPVGVDTAIGLLKARCQMTPEDEAVIRKLMEIDGVIAL